jgi:uncharacterized membrane protein
MNQLVVLTLPDRTKIEETIRTLRKLHSEGGIKFYASAVVTKDGERKLSVQEITKEGHGGTAVAALIGALAGLPAGPAAAAIMATGGAVLGNATDLSAEDDFNEFANNIADYIAPGGAAIVADVAEDGVTAFKAAMQGLGATALSQ